MALRFSGFTTDWINDFWARASQVVWAADLGLFVGCGGTNDGSDGAIIATSPDGLNWTKQTVPSDPRDPPALMQDICWSPDVALFVAVGDDADYTSIASTTNTYWTSPDGVNWTARGKLFTDNWPASVCWSPTLGLFVATSGEEATALSHVRQIKTSADGVTWTNRTTPLDSSMAQVIDSCWSPDLGMFVAIANRYSFPSGAFLDAKILTSSDGVNWSVAATNAEQVLAVDWYPFAGQFLVTVTTSGTLGDLVSSDGSTWTHTSDNTGLSVRGLWNFADVYAIQRHTNATKLGYSTDLDAWVDTINTGDHPLAGAWSPELDLGVAVGGGISISGPDPVTGAITGDADANGTVASNTVEEDVEWYFQWGLTALTVDDNSMPAQTQGPGFTDEAVLQTLGPGLDPETTYYYRLAATHRGVTHYGSTESFTTPPEPPLTVTPSFHRVYGIDISLTDDGVEGPVTVRTTDFRQEEA